MLAGLACFKMLSQYLRSAFQALCGGHRRFSSTLSEEDKRATTNVQNGLVFFFLFSFIFSSLWTKTVVKPFNSKKKVLEEKF